MTTKSAPMTDTETSDWPTPEMLKAGMDDLGWWVEPYEAPRESGVPVDSDMSAEDAAKINAMQMEVVESAFRAMLAAAPKPQGAYLEPVADDLVERLRAHEGIGAAMAPTHGTGRYVCAIMDEAASALQSAPSWRPRDGRHCQA